MFKLFVLLAALVPMVMASNETDAASESAGLFDPNDYPIGAVVIVFTGVVGVTVNGYVFFAVRKAKCFGYAFGRIVQSHTVANFGNCFVFGFLIAPIIIINPDVHATYWGARCGQFLIMVYNASLFSHLLTAINRFCVVFFPLKYNILFDERTTKVSICIVWAIAVLQVMPYFADDCTLYFDKNTLMMLPKPTSCSTFVVLVMCYYLSCFVIALFALFDFLTFMGIRFHNRNQILGTPGVNDRVNRKKEIRFFFQACLQDCAFLAELILYFSVAPYFTHIKWAHFMLTTFLWITVHTADGIIVILFNKEVRKALQRSKGAESSSHPQTNPKFVSTR